MEKIKKLVIMLLILTAGIPSVFAQNTECTGTTNELSQGSGLPNYKYTFTTTGTDVTVEFEVLSPLTGLVAFAWTFNPGFQELPMTNVGGQKFRRVYSGQTAGATFTVACKFAWAAGGFAVTRNFTYTVGNTCGGGGNPAPEFGTFTVPAKVLGDAPFELIAPTSTSSGAFTYTSSNTGVATISGTTVTVVGGGTSTITANQAADATHSAGSTTASLVVTVANTTPAAGPSIPPVRNSWDVLSEYGNAYTNQPGVAFFDFGGSTIVGDVVLADNSVVKKYTNHLYSGIGTNGALSLNVAAMTYLHIDVWSPDFVSFKIKLEAANGSNVELEVPGAKTQGSWNSYDIPLSSYSAVDLAHLKYIVPVSNDGAGRTLFITNVYFYRPTTTQPPTLGTFTVPAKNVGDADFALVPPTSNSVGAWTYSSSNTAVATIVGGNSLHIVGGGSSTITATQAANGAFGPGLATATFVASYPAPGASPIPPARDPGDVVSMFTGTPAVYANGVTAVRADWSNGATTMTSVSNGTNTALRVDNMGYLGYVTNGANFSVSGMTRLHVDVYLNTSLPSLFVFLLAPGDNIYTATNLAAGWNSLDIDLSNYSGADLSNIYGLKFESNSSPAAFQMYLDNIYFYVPTGINPTITDFNVDAHVLGDAPFALTPPTSDSTGAFTYTSSNTGVATISGSTVTIVGAGSSIITAFQVADGGYEAGSITATLVVSNPPLATAAPAPPARNDWDVISLYSNAYTEQSSPVWQNIAATTDEQLEGNDTKKMSNFLVEIINFAPTNLTAMTTLHMDVYSEDCTGMNIWLLNNGDRNAHISITPNQWNSIDIPLSTYVNLGLNMNGVSLLKFESLNGGGKTVYVDNIYFYRPATFLPATLTDFTIPAQAVGNPDFVLTPPTSNSSGTFTYTSSNTAVATISGDTVHIVGGGTSTITATQAANGSYGSASITTQLTVAFPAPPASPIPPARTPDRVVSMYTGNPPTYANAITAVRSTWTGATTLTEVPNGTNTALRLDNFGFLGLVDQNETHFSATGMSNLHVDVYLHEPLNANPALSRIFIYLLSNGDQLYSATNLVAGWNSLSIPLSQFPNANLADIYGLKFENPSAASTQIYLDNIYFSNECYTYYADADADGYGDANNSIAACEATPGYVLDNTDCNDSLAAINPGATEILYNGVDDNCNGQIDDNNQLTSHVIASQCGTTLTSISSNISAISIAQVNGYRWEVTNTATNAVQVLETGLQFFHLTQLASYDYATTYSIRVMLRRNGVWLGYYGSSCLVSSPAVLSPGGATQVSPSQCGITLSSISQLISTTSLAGVTGYRFRITNLTDSAAPNQVQILDRPLQWFNLPMLSTYNYGTTYQIEVSIKTNGVYSGFGAPCNITSPSVPALTQCGGIIATPGTLISTTSLAKATSYRFEITNLVTSQVTTIDRALHYFSFNNVPGYSAATQYGVRVAVMTSGVYSPFSDACEITSPGTARPDGIKSVEKTVFGAVAYPNPFAQSVNIDVKTGSDESISVKVYDMTGRLLETRIVETSEMETLQVGDRYPAGVYNIIVRQGENVKTIRIIKR